MVKMWYNIYGIKERFAIMNEGKIFEQEFKDSVAKYNKENDTLYLLRLTDSASGFGQDSNKVRFSVKSPYDFLLHQKGGKTFALELKSCKSNSIAFSLENDQKSIKSSQVKNLLKSEFYGIFSGFLLNFRKFEETYFLGISSFLEFAKQTEKKSISRQDVIDLGGVIIPQKKKKVKYIYDISALLEIG